MGPLGLAGVHAVSVLRGDQDFSTDLTFSNDQGVYWKVQAVVVH